MLYDIIDVNLLKKENIKKSLVNFKNKNGGNEMNKNNLFNRLVLIALIIISVISLSTEARAASDVSVNLDGKKINFDQPPVIVDGRTLVPIRAIFEAMDMGVEWNGKTQVITAKKGNVKIILQVKNPKASIGNDELGYIETYLDVPPQIINARTMVPVRFIAEASGATVGWNQGLRTVIITSNPNRKFIKSQGTEMFEGRDINSVYLGYVENELAEGYGRNIWEDGDVYVGEFIKDMRNGFGIYSFASGEEYVGEWKDNMYHGFGIKTLPDGEQYVGMWKDDVAHGFGTNTWADGEQYVGEWRNDMRNGFGTNISADGEKLTGEWEDNILIISI